MNISIDKRKIILGIQAGLSTTRTEIYTSNTLTCNRRHMEKWDNIVTSIQHQFLENDKYLFIPLKRGLFDPVMMYDQESKILYTIIKKQNFKKITSRKSIQNSHYIDAMLDYNLAYQETPRQLSLFDCENMFSENAESQIIDLKCNIEKLLNTDKIKKYITIVIDFSGYILTEIRAVMCSKWLEEIDSENWTEFIMPSYEEIEDSGRIDYVQENELKAKISVKPAMKKERGLA